MKVLESPISIIIPQKDKDDKKKHYTKATVINSNELDGTISKFMDTELLYGDLDYY